MQSISQGQEEGTADRAPHRAWPGGYKTHQSTLLLFIKGGLV